MPKLFVRLAAAGILLAAITPASWGAPSREPIEASPQSGFLPVLSGFWSDLQVVWSKALGVVAGESSSTRTPAPAEPATSLDGGGTCQEVGTWAGCINDPDG
jgi:hypothetical protein